MQAADNNGAHTIYFSVKIFLNKIPNIGAQCSVAASFEKSKR